MKKVLNQEKSTTQNKGKIHVQARANNMEYYHIDIPIGRGGVWSLTPLSTIAQLCRSGQCNWWRKLEYPEKTTGLP